MICARASGASSVPPGWGGGLFTLGNSPPAARVSASSAWIAFTRKGMAEDGVGVADAVLSCMGLGVVAGDGTVPFDDAPPGDTTPGAAEFRTSGPVSAVSVVACVAV